MPHFDVWKHRRRSVRLPDHDYMDGAYFVTVCAHDDVMYRNAFGDVVYEEWLHTERSRNNVALDEFVIMPNHFHAVLFIIPETPPVGAQRAGKCASKRGS
ncbi:MAG: hypothetical protein AAF787_20125 [Chloroflexota bacterium]